LSYVSIWKPVNDRIVEAAAGSENEIIGLLLGRLEDDAIIIEDSITGECSADANRVVLPSYTLAKIADDLVSGRVKGNVVGWYHSHSEGGLFFSGTDSQTQKKLQQFSPLVVGMVIDATSGTVGCYRVDPETGKPIRIPDEMLRIYEEPSAAIAPELKGRPPVRPTLVIQMRRALVQLKLPARTLVLVVVMIALVASGILIGALLYRGMTAAPALSISHIPILTTTIGTPIEVRTNVTGPAQTVRLFYGVANSGPLTVAGMSSSSPVQYSYTIPGDQVTGSILYYIEATDSSSNRIRSNMYDIQIADFRVIATNTTLTVYRTKSVASQLNLLLISGFNKPVTLAAAGQPPGLLINFSQNPVPSGITSVNMNVMASQQATSGTFTFTVTGTFLPPSAKQVTRQATVKVTVADFSLQVTPASQQLNVGGMTTYQLNLAIEQGFADRVNVSVQGLPSGAVGTFSTGGDTLGLGPGMTTITLQVTTTVNVMPGAYTLTIIASGGGLVHSEIVQLTVR
jgi:proteasome lid subunit RPN8/RPN11